MKQKGKLRGKWALKNISPGLVTQVTLLLLFSVTNRKKENEEKKEEPQSRNY